MDWVLKVIQSIWNRQWCNSIFSDLLVSISNRKFDAQGPWTPRSHPKSVENKRTPSPPPKNIRVTSSVLLRLLTRIKHLLPRHSRLFFYNSLVLPIFDYADIIWGDKNNTILMENLQVSQNKAAKIILDRPLRSSASDARSCLGWLDLAQRRRLHRCLFVYKIVNGLLKHHLEIISNKDVHGNDTRSKGDIRLSIITRSWGKQRLAYHAKKRTGILCLQILEVPDLYMFLRISCLSTWVDNI